MQKLYNMVFLFQKTGPVCFLLVAGVRIRICTLGGSNRSACYSNAASGNAGSLVHIDLSIQKFCLAVCLLLPLPVLDISATAQCSHLTTALKQVSPCQY